MHNDDEVLRQLDALVREIVGHPVDPDENYFTAGLDSLAVTKLHTLLTRRLGVTLPVMALFRRPTLRATATAVVARRAADEATRSGKTIDDAHPAAAEPQDPVPGAGATTPVRRAAREAGAPAAREAGAPAALGTPGAPGAPGAHGAAGRAALSRREIRERIRRDSAPGGGTR
ncbi:acyl carrier protein [Virgisporangium aurantiacum]|uniref:Carrier domain-containing protein n=1 Tax=Virgisporangium aurantiacum TaxID=175570 RepID=A0A8J4DZ58_9ACTN|nr:acyl carrier protein [Virgisporangium aurantiacum]GIJ56365.1 hypothetical protein Vau01_038810 [Virgisporangium aurantiacum]